jgi:DNA replication protein DnaC
MTVYDCERCRDEEGYLIRSEGREAWKICECAAVKRIKKLVKTSQITEQFQKLTFETFITDEKPAPVIQVKNAAMQYVKQFAEIEGERCNSFAVVGQVGSGKTHLTCSIANELLKSGIQVLYFPYVEGINNLKSNFDEIEQKTDYIKKVRVLFIDDLFKGRDKPTAFQIETIFSIINYRYLNHLPVLLTSEKDFENLLDIDEALGSRIYEMTRGNRFVLKGQNMNHRLKNR